MARTKKKSAKMNMVHFWTLVSRYFRQQFSSVPSLVMLIMQAPVLLLIALLIYDKDCFIIPGKIISAHTITFVIVFFAGLMGLLNTYREITKEQDILRREMGGGLDPIGYVASKMFVQAAFCIVQSLMIVFGSLLFIDFGFRHFAIDLLLYFLAVFLVMFSSSAIGLMISAIITKSESAILPVLLLIICQVAFCGLFIDVPPPVSYIGYIAPVRWGLALFGNVLNLNEQLPGVTKAVFDEKIILSIIFLVAITIVSYIITVGVIKGKSKNKKLK